MVTINFHIVTLHSVLRRSMMLRPLLTFVEALKEFSLHKALLCESLIYENNQLKKVMLKGVCKVGLVCHTAIQQRKIENHVLCI